jgi:S-adenosylmethionine decarboxylase
VDAYGCDPSRLRSLDGLQALFAQIVEELGLRPVAPPTWHQFPEAGGVTGLVALSESHLACHTFPERGFAALNLYCCRPRASWPWAERLAEALGATDVQVNTQSRGVGSQVVETDGT